MIQSEIAGTPTVETNYDKEPIHIPGCIQPHGLLFALQEPELTFLQVSNNTFDFFGLQPHELLEKNIDKLLNEDQVNYLKKFINSEDIKEVNPLNLTLEINAQKIAFDCIVHRANNSLILELEPSLPETSVPFFRFYHLVRPFVSKLQSAANLDELCQTAVKEVRNLTGFDRVMVYQFNRQGNGAVIAESKTKSLEPFLGLNYPDFDIPEQAKKLYCLNWLRLITDVDYKAVEIVPICNPVTNRPLDLSQSVLRSVSPCHLEYLHNMEVKASMSISLIKDGELWGLIACHHQSPKRIPYEVRTACEFLGQVMSLELSNKEGNEDYEYRIEQKSIQAKLIEYLSLEENFISGVIKYKPNLPDLVRAQGAVVCFGGDYIIVGETPSLEEIKRLIEWLGNNFTEEVFSTDSLPSIYQEAETFKDIASGLLAVSISKAQKNCILWFRPEVIQTVNWGGNPNKHIEVENGELRLHPRKSFELWKQTVRFKSLPWKQCEIDAALEFRNAIISIVLRKADELAKINVELEQSNSELDAFAYIASHDLKEPLRGIHNYSCFLLEDYAEKLDETAVSKLNTLIRLTQRMEDLIDSLLHISQVGRVDFSVEKTDLNYLVNHILEILSVRIEQTKVDIRIPRPLPTIRCDRIRVGEVFKNLITKAIKYNDKAEKWLEIGFKEPTGHRINQTTQSNENEPGEPIIFYVRDNGIGIRQKHLDAIFRIFKRLHGTDKYGGGTGAGLTIAKKIVERHGGNIWVESTFGEGTTFYFTLQS